jgi:hypothetical protein
MVHKAKMESTADKAFLKLYGLPVHVNSLVYKVSLRMYLSLSLKSKTLGMPQLGVGWGYFQSHVVVFVSGFELPIPLPVQEHIATVEVNSWVIWIFFNRDVKVSFRFFLLTIMVISQPSVIMMNTSLSSRNINLYSF